MGRRRSSSLKENQCTYTTLKTNPPGSPGAGIISSTAYSNAPRYTYRNKPRTEVIHKLQAYSRNTGNLQALSLAKRYGDCGRWVTKETVEIHRHEGGGCVVGVWNCRDRQCPRCSPFIESKERDNLRTALINLHESGQTAGLAFYDGAFTMRHTSADNPHTLMDQLTKATSDIQRSAWFKAACFGLVLKLEVSGSKDAKNGLHPHIHFIAALSDVTDPAAFFARVEAFFQARLGADRVNWAAGWWKRSCDPMRLPDYLAKKRWCVVEEVTLSNSKDGSLWAMAPGDFLEIHRIMHGRHSFRASGIFRDAIRLVKSTPAKLPTRIVARLPAIVWRALDADIRRKIEAIAQAPGDAGSAVWLLLNYLGRFPSSAHLAMGIIETVLEAPG